MDRFQDTMLLLKDYYTSMEGELTAAWKSGTYTISGLPPHTEKPPERLPDVCRVALIDLPPTEAPDPPSSQTGSTQSVVPTSSSKPVLAGGKDDDHTKRK